MTRIDTSIEIDRTPAEVRAVVLDFDKLSEWHSSFIKVMRPEPTTKGGVAPTPYEMKPGKKAMWLNFLNIGSKVDIVENSETGLTWEGGPGLLFHGKHSLGFEPLDGGKRTKFTNGETFTGLFGEGAGLPGIKGQVMSLYHGYNKDLKKRAESIPSTSTTAAAAEEPAGTTAAAEETAPVVESQGVAPVAATATA